MNIHLWGRAELDSVVNQIGALGLNGPVLTATDGLNPPGYKVSCACSGGATWGQFCAPCAATFGHRTRYQSIWRTPYRSWTKGVATSFRSAHSIVREERSISIKHTTESLPVKGLRRVLDLEVRPTSRPL